MELIESILQDIELLRNKIVSAKSVFDITTKGIIQNVEIKIRRNIIIINGVHYRVQNLKLEFDNELD